MGAVFENWVWLLHVPSLVVYLLLFFVVFLPEAVLLDIHTPVVVFIERFNLSIKTTTGV